jgi:CHAD domain-containing protein
VTSAAPRFRLNTRQPTARALGRLALEQVAHALAGARRADARGIHEARKACKRLRALLRVMRAALGDAYAPQNRRLRDAARALSRARDADVLRATARSLRAGLAVNLPARHRLDRAARRHAVGLLQLQRRAILRWPFDVPTRAGLEAGITRGYRRALRAARQARRKPRATVLHEWRKQVKYHRFQCEAVATLWPALGRRAAALDELGERLGRHHDLEVLALALQRQPQRFGSPPVVLRAARRLGNEQERIARRALAQGARLFREPAGAWFTREARR